MLQIETVIGASVVVKGTTNGTITGLDGDFSLSNVKKGDIIQISFVGYITQEVLWNGTPLNVILKDDTQTLDEVVVVAFWNAEESECDRCCRARDCGVLLVLRLKLCKGLFLA